MISTSPAYQTAIAQAVRSTIANVYFGVYDVTAKSEASAVADTSQSFSNVSALKDNVRTPLVNVATFEDDYFRLDGSFCLMPDDVNISDTLGWWSTNQSQADKSFASPPTLTITFSSLHSSLGIGLFFDPLGLSYCTDFDITWYNGATLVDYSMITGNTQIGFNLTKSVSNWNKVVIRFLKTDSPYRYARLLEINYGLEQLFDSNKIIEAAIVEEMDPSGAFLTTNTLKLTLMNQDQSFNMLNPAGVYAYLQKKQQLVASSGLLLPSGLYEYVALGTYYLSDWKNSTGLTATLEATDVTGLWDKTTYYTSPFWVNAPINTVINHILSDAGSFPYTLDASLSSEVVNGYIPIMSHREAIQTLILACRGAVRIERTGIAKFMRPDYATVNDTVGYDVVIGTPEIEQKPLITAVNATEFAYTLNSSAETLYAATMSITGNSTMIIPYSKDPVDPSSVSVVVTGSGTLTTAVNSATCSTVTVNGTGSLTITITGKAYTSTSKTVVVKLGSISAGEVPQAANIEDNTLISSVGKAAVVAQYVLDYYQHRIKQSFDYWDDPSIQSGDNLSIQTMFGTSQKGIVEHQEITFAPNLKGRIEVTG